MADIFVQRSDGIFVSFTGQDQATVVSLLQNLGLTGTFLTQAQYQSAIAALPKSPLSSGPSIEQRLATLEAKVFGVVSV